MESSYSQSQQNNLETIYRFAEECEYDAVHALHVTFLSLRLFDEIKSLFHFGDLERYWLHCAGVLHDIGWMDGWKEHHKNSLNTILNAAGLPFDNKERLMIGSIARYHRGALPNQKHDHYAALKPDEQITVNFLSSCLRLADGFDHSRQRAIRDIFCKPHEKKIVIFSAYEKDPGMEVLAANKKKDLLEIVSQRKVQIKFKSAL